MEYNTFLNMVFNSCSTRRSGVRLDYHNLSLNRTLNLNGVTNYLYLIHVDRTMFKLDL